MAEVPPSILTQATPAGGPGSAPAVTPNSTFCPTGGGGGGYRPGNDGYGNAHGTPSARPLRAAGGAGGGDLFGLLRGFLTILPLWGLGRRHRLPAPHLPWPSAPRPPAWREPRCCTHTPSSRCKEAAVGGDTQRGASSRHPGDPARQLVSSQREREALRGRGLRTPGKHIPEPFLPSWDLHVHSAGAGCAEGLWTVVQIAE